jgi:hypothetical protein
MWIRQKEMQEKENHRRERGRGGESSRSTMVFHSTADYLPFYMCVCVFFFSFPVFCLPVLLFSEAEAQRPPLKTKKTIKRHFFLFKRRYPVCAGYHVKTLSKKKNEW